MDSYTGLAKSLLAIPENQRNKVPADSEQFISNLVLNYPTLLPICHLLNEEEIHLLSYAFYKNAHGRHILDMEGGHNMLSSLTTGIVTKEITLERFNLWFARWIINIAGLEGHINPQGSIYLTNPVAHSIVALNAELKKLWEYPQHDVLDHYLEYRAKGLEVSSPYVAYFGALMRRYSPKIGREIQAWFTSLSITEQLEHQSRFNKQLKETKVTPSYKPTVLQNLLALGCSVFEALTIFTQIEAHAFQAYAKSIQENILMDTTPLSFRNIAFKEYLTPILDYFRSHNELPEFQIDCGGYLSVSPEAFLRQLSPK